MFDWNFNYLSWKMEISLDVLIEILIWSSTTLFSRILIYFLNKGPQFV